MNVLRWQKENKRNIALKIVVFLLNPLFSLVVAFSRLKTRSSFFLLFFIFVLFGASLTVPSIRTEEFNYDGIEYRIQFEEYLNVDLLNYLTRLKDYFSFEGRSDFYSDTLFFLVSCCTGNYHLMFFVVSVIFSFFMLKSLKIFVLESNYTNTISCLLLTFLFLINHILNINMFRFFTAAWIAIYSLLNLFVLNKRSYIFLLLLTPFFHGSFFIFYVFLLFYYLLGNRTFCLFFFVFSFFFGSAVELLQGSMAFLPANIGMRLDLYLNENYMYEINEGGSGFIWIKRLLETLDWFFVNFIILLFFLKFKTHISETKCENLFLFLMILISFVNCTMIIPSMGSRFMLLTIPLIAYIGLVCFWSSWYKKVLSCFSIFVLMQAFLPFSIRLLPCIKEYFDLWELPFFLVSPVISFIKYVFLY